MKKPTWYALPPVPTALIAAGAAAALAVTFKTGGASPFAFFSYLFSTYALILICSGMVRLVRALNRAARNRRLSQAFRADGRAARYLDDPVYRMQINLYFGTAVNFLYIFIKFFTGMTTGSLWLIVFALYYAVLTVLRAFLAQYVRRYGLMRDIPAEYRRSRLVGILLLPMDLVLCLILIRMIGHREANAYPDLLIYAMAAVILAVIGRIRFRRYESPVISAVKTVHLTAAMVAMLSLEAAMLQHFGDPDDTRFRGVMLGISGLAVSLLILGMSARMVFRASRYRKKREEKHHERTF